MENLIGITAIVISGFAGGLFTLGYKLKARLELPDKGFSFLYGFTFMLFALLFILFKGDTLVEQSALLWGIPYGVAMYVSVVMYASVIGKVRLSISWTIIQFSILIPLISSLIFFEAEMNIFSLTGSVLVLISIATFGLAKRHEGAESSETSQADLGVGLRLFLASLFSGIGLAIPLFYVSSTSESQPMVLLFYASLFMTLMVLVTLRKVDYRQLFTDWKAVGVPTGMSFLQLSATFLLMVGLLSLQGSVAYPLKSVLGLLFVYTLSHLVLKERLLFLEKVAIVIALIAILLTTRALH